MNENRIQYDTCAEEMRVLLCIYYNTFFYKKNRICLNKSMRVCLKRVTQALTSVESDDTSLIVPSASDIVCLQSERGGQRSKEPSEKGESSQRE